MFVKEKRISNLQNYLYLKLLPLKVTFITYISAPKIQAMSGAGCLPHILRELSISLVILSALPLYQGKLYSNDLTLM